MRRSGLFFLFLTITLFSTLSCSAKNRAVIYSDGEKRWTINSLYNEQKLLTVAGKVINTTDISYANAEGGFGFMNSEVLASSLSLGQIVGNTLDTNTFLLTFIPTATRDFINSLDLSKMSDEQILKSQERVDSEIWNYFLILRSDKNKKELNAAISQWEEELPNRQQIGQYKNSIWFLFWADKVKGSLSDSDYSNAKALLDDIENFKNNLILFPPDAVKKSKEPAFKGNLSNFATTDINGDEVTQDIFKDYYITMINVWATYCGPCIAEMGALAKLQNNLPDGVNFISICVDLNGNEKKALQILNDAKALFPVLYANKKMHDSILNNVQGVPTTFMVNNRGQLVGQVQVGAPSRDESSIIKHYALMAKTALAMVKRR